MRKIQKLTIVLVQLISILHLVSCQVNNTTDSSQTGDIPQINITDAALTPTVFSTLETVDDDLSFGTKIEIPDSKRWIQMLRTDRKYGILGLSPNGKWISLFISLEQSKRVLELIPTWDNNLTLVFQPESSLGIIGYSNPTWSPDSKNLAYLGMNAPSPRCPDSRLVILQIDSVSLTARPVVFEFTGNGLYCASFVWSPDNSMLAVNQHYTEGIIYILDIDGNILDEVPIPIIEEDSSIQFGSFVWTPANLFYTVYHNDYAGSNTLYQLDLDTGESARVFHLGEWQLSGVDIPNSSKLLITRHLSQYRDPTLPYVGIDEYAILDIETLEIHKLEWDSPTCKVVTSTSIYIAFACDKPHELWIYNGDSEVLANYGEYGKVVGWSDFYQGYLLQEGSEENPRIEVLKP